MRMWTLSDFISLLFQEKTFQPFQDFINSFFPKAANNICLIESQHIKECVDYIADKKCKQDWAPVTINRMLELISSVFIYSMKRKYRVDNPTLDVRKLPVPQNDTPEFFSYEELSDIWITIDSYWLPFLKFLYHTGIRKGELINLTWDKINLEREPATMRIVSFIRLPKSLSFRSSPSIIRSMKS